MNKMDSINCRKEEILTKKEIKLVNHLPDIGNQQLKKEIIGGLKSFPKYISSKFFYDEKGSELFETITELDEYYPTRTEKSILSTIVRELDLDFSGGELGFEFALPAWIVPD